MKRLGEVIVTSIILLSLMSSVFAADKIEDNGVTATSINNTSISSTTESIPFYDLTTTIEQSSDGKEINVTLELKDDFKSDVSGGSIYLTYNKDLLIYKSIDKEKLIGPNDFIEYDRDNSSEGIVGINFTSDENNDVVGKLLTVTFIKKDTVRDGDKLVFEFVETSTSGINKSELLINNGSIIGVKGKSEYVVGTTSDSTDSSTTDSLVIADNTENRDGRPDVVITEVTRKSEEPTATDIKTKVTADTIKTKTGAEDYLLLSLALFLVSGVLLVMKNKRSI